MVEDPNAPRINSVSWLQNVNQYIEPVIHHSTQFVLKTVVETIKIIAASVFLHLLANQFITKLNLGSIQILKIVLVNPLVQEIVFRGIVLRGIHLIQKSSNYIQGRVLTPQEENVQQVFRVRLSAFLFSVTQLMESHQNALSVGIEFAWNYLSGLAYGYVSEKYKTLALPILFSGLNNALILGSMIFPYPLALALIIHHNFVYRLGTTNDQTIVTDLKNMSSHNVSDLN